MEALEGAEAVVAAIVGGEEGVAELVLDDGSGGVSELVRVQVGGPACGAEPGADGFRAAQAQAPAGGVADETCGAGVGPGTTGTDDGAFHVDAEALATLAPDSAATLVVRRVRVTPVDVPGLEDAFARVAVTRELPADLR